MTDIAPGWPCALLPAIPPSVSDKLAAPTADDILPQLLQLTPRGPAWGTDEAGDGTGARPIMLAFWRAVAGHAAYNYAIDFELATQCFPSAITYSLPDWESEYGLPDTCLSGVAGTPQRVVAVRSKFGAIGGQSPAYFVCLASAIGYDVTIEEPNQFLCDDSVCVGTGTYEGYFICDDDVCVGAPIEEDWFYCDDGACDDTPLQFYVVPADPYPSDFDGDLEYFILDTDPDADDPDNEVSDETVWKFWIVHVGAAADTWFYADEGECNSDPLEGFLPATDLECEFRRLCPPHTQLVFDYSALPYVAVLDFSNPLNSGLLGLL
ncbi:putative phage tail protein [Beijerinckia sp. L45]|uniref:putative phage tail protein n=1 Tax=Beijerinckia sp. L45 TaxID=1641855 RepID=UPI00131A9750|nr:putative phage tail protein [Beijerinckia sp. L45]